MNTPLNNAPPNRGLWTRLIAWSSCLLAMGSWGLAILTWGWVFTRPHGTFHDQGVVILAFVIFPRTFGLWLVGGPIALALGGLAAKRVRSGYGTKRDGQLALAGIVLSRVMLWCGVGLLLMMLLLSFLGW